MILLLTAPLLDSIRGFHTNSCPAVSKISDITTSLVNHDCTIAMLPSAGQLTVRVLNGLARRFRLSQSVSLFVGEQNRPNFASRTQTRAPTNIKEWTLANLILSNSHTLSSGCANALSCRAGPCMCLVSKLLHSGDKFPTWTFRSKRPRPLQTLT